MSTEQDRETLIAEARNWASGREGWNQYEHDLGYRLADAIEALVKERAELAAVIEKARLAPVQRVPDAVGLSGTVSDVLRETPADVLREHDAALIESLAARAPERRVAVGGGWTALVSSPCAEWLRDCARQVREGEA